MRRWPVHPLLFAVFPVLFLFTQNAHVVRPGKILLPLGVVALCAAVSVSISWLVFRDLRRAAIAASGSVVLGLSYGHVWTALESKAIGGLVVGRDLFLLPLWGLLAALIVFLALRVRALGDATAVLNAIAGGVVLVSLVNTGTALANQAGEPLQTRAGERSVPIAEPAGPKTQRDIFYLVFDRYAGPEVLRREFGFDNGPFLDALRERGFYVADRSVSNYPRTAHSLAASMNMEHLDELAAQVGRDAKDWRPLYEKLVGTRVSKFLQEQGYRYAHIGPWYDPTAHDPTAQINYHYNKQSEFSRVLLETTLLHAAAKRFDFLSAIDGRRVAHNQVRFQFESILDAAKLDGPTFVFAHLLVPHEPFTFDAAGNYVSKEEERVRSYERNYVGQVRFVNSKILEILDRLLAIPEERRPIVVLQADEGPHPFEVRYGNDASWKDASDAELRVKFPILNAYYLPGGRKHGLYADITPVNSFRRIFDAYFDTHLGLVPDDAYVFGTADQPYAFERVTDRLASSAR